MGKILKDVIEFLGSNIKYMGETITLGPKAIYLDASLKDDVVNTYNYVYADIKEALGAKALTDGSEEEPMTVYIAPYVYWIHDPGGQDTVEKSEGNAVPYGMVVKCEWLKLYGLTTEPGSVVIAGNRGQSHGANGNYTMFHFIGEGLRLENITIGNYCSIDLNYPLKPDLNYPKRTTAITQAQLGIVSGDKFLAKHCCFMGRLNLCPMIGANRSLYVGCHFESTDDALNGNGVYLACDFDFYGGRPIYKPDRTGVTFLNCIFRSWVTGTEGRGYQYFSKESGPVAVVDCQFISDSEDWQIAWTKYPEVSLQCYQYNVRHDKHSINIGGEMETVDMEGKEILYAYRVQYNDKVYYNTYNLLKGSDDWDPMGIKKVIKEAEEINKKSYSDIPTLLSIESTQHQIESGKTTAHLSCRALFFDHREAVLEGVVWAVGSEDEPYVKLIANGDGTYTLEGTNTEEVVKQVSVEVFSSFGLKGSMAIEVKPTQLKAPEFIHTPRIVRINKGQLHLSYTLDLEGREDYSSISWYRCKDEKASEPILVSVSRFNQPKYDYTLSLGDVGYYIMAKIEPKHIRSIPSEGVITVDSKAIEAAEVIEFHLKTDFSDFPTEVQNKIIPGFWTVDRHQPKDLTQFSSWIEAEAVEPWKYGETGNGSVGRGLYQGVQGARLMYTPVAGSYGDMLLKLIVDPAKTTGQGFGSAGQYMDVCIEFDTTELSGYGLRIMRTKEASNACAFMLVRYDKGLVQKLSEPITSSCYATGCEITLETKQNQLLAHVKTSAPQLLQQQRDGLKHQVDLSATISHNPWGGIMIYHTGTTGTAGWQNTTMLHDLEIQWEILWL